MNFLKCQGSRAVLRQEVTQEPAWDWAHAGRAMPQAGHAWQGLLLIPLPAPRDQWHGESQAPAKSTGRGPAPPACLNFPAIPAPLPSLPCSSRISACTWLSSASLPPTAAAGLQDTVTVTNPAWDGGSPPAPWTACSSGLPKRCCTARRGYGGRFGAGRDVRTRASHADLLQILIFDVLKVGEAGDIELIPDAQKVLLQLQLGEQLQQPVRALLCLHATAQPLPGHHARLGGTLPSSLLPCPPWGSHPQGLRAKTGVMPG